MKKETIFSLLLFGILFLIPNKVKAKMNDVSIDGVYTYQWNKDTNTYQSVEIVRDFYINGQDVYFSTTVDYYLNYFDVLINKETFKGLNYNHYYDISGTLSIFDGIKHPNDNLFNSGIYIEPHNNISSRTKCLYNFTRVDKESGLSQVDFICPSVEIKENQAYLISVYTYDIHMPRVAFSRKFDFIEHASNDSVMQGIDNIQQTQDETNNKLDEINNADISEADKEMPDDGAYQDYSKSEKDLLDKTKEVDLNVLDVGLDTKSSTWVWDTLTRIIQSHSAIFGMFIGILTVGIIKLILGR